MRALRQAMLAAPEAFSYGRMVSAKTAASDDLARVLQYSGGALGGAAAGGALDEALGLQGEGDLAGAWLPGAVMGLAGAGMGRGAGRAAGRVVGGLGRLSNPHMRQAALTRELERAWAEGDLERIGKLRRALGIKGDFE